MQEETNETLDKLESLRDLEKMQIPEDSQFTRTYTSFSGVDVTPYVWSGGKLTPVLVMQGISIRSGLDKTRGDFICLVFHETLFQVGDHFDFIVLQAVSEHGQEAWSALVDVKITMHCTGVSVDDITVTDDYTYTAKRYVPWKQGRAVVLKPKNPDRTDGPLCPELADGVQALLEGE